MSTGDPVRKVLYVTKGTCISERSGRVANIEYHQDWSRGVVPTQEVKPYQLGQIHMELGQQTYA